MKSCLLISVISIINFGNIYSTTYYVSTSGNNSNSGLTQAMPWRTLSYAAGTYSPIVAGDTVYIKTGNYGAENVIFKKSGVLGKPIAFLGYKTTPGDRPALLVTKANPFASFAVTEMPTFDGGNRALGTCFNCENQKFIVIKNFQIQNYANGIIAGSTSQTNAENLTLYNINLMSLGDINASYSGEGILLGNMGTKFSNNDTLINCLVVNASAEGFGVNGDKNMLKGCQVYCNENTNNNASTDYYIIVCGSYNTITSCYIERAPGLLHAGHGIGVKSNAEQVVDKGLSLPVITPQYNKFYFNTAINMGESFYVRHRTCQNNLFYHCKAIGTHTGAIDSPEGEGKCMITRDGSSNNTFDGCIAENCNSGIVFDDTVEDGDTGTNPTGHPGNDNKYINCKIYNCYIGVNYSDYSIQSDAGNNTIAYCTFYQTRYLHYAARHCANMKYIGNIYYGCLPINSGGYFKGSTYASDILPNGTNTYFKNCDFINIQGGMPANFIASATGSISTDPLFINPNALDFHLQLTSPCKDQGVILSTVSNDFDGLSRPQGGAYDIGAYEYQINIIPPTPLSATLSLTNVKCNGGMDGSATVIPSGGIAPYTYSWSNGQKTTTATGLSAGNYTVTVSDANASSNTFTVTITQLPAITSIISSQTNANCNGVNNGSATVVAAGGVGNYTYSWNTSPIQTTSTATALSAANYTVTIADANGCVINNTITITQVSAITSIISSQTNASCNKTNNGSATINATGGVGNYIYSWNTLPIQTTATATDLPAANYTVTVADANGCIVKSTVTITEPAPLQITLSIRNSRCPYNTGRITATPLSGTSNYIYSWSTSPIQTTNIISGLSPGQYSVTIYDSIGCSKKLTATVYCRSSRDIEAELGSNLTVANHPLLKESSMNVFPNPSVGLFNLLISGIQVGKSLMIVVKNILGEELYSKETVISLNEETFTINAAGLLSPGIYTVITTTDDAYFENRIVIQ